MKNQDKEIKLGSAPKAAMLSSKKALSAQTRKRRGQLIFCLIVLIFALPFVASTLLFNKGWAPTQQTNLGLLLTPPPQLPDMTFMALEKDKGMTELQGHWWFVGVMPHHCDLTCQHDLHQMRQIHVALGKSGERIQRLWVSEHIDAASLPEKDKWRLHVLERDRAFLQTYFPGSENRPDFFIIDPQGYVILRYTEDQLGKDIQKDFTRLLKYTSEGIAK